MNKKGFIATSLIYSFFLIFITLFLTIIADYLQNKVLLNTIEKGIKEDINNGLECSNIFRNDQLVFQGNNFNGIEYSDNLDLNGNTLYIVSEDCSNGFLTVYEKEDNTNTITINMNNKSFTKEPSDGEFYTITGVK